MRLSTKGKTQLNDGKAIFSDSANISYYKAQDGWFTAAPVTQAFFTRFADAIGRPELKTDHRCSDMRARTKNRTWYRNMLLEHFQLKPRQDWIDALVAVNIPCGIVHDYESLVKDGQVWANGYLEKIAGTRWGDNHTVVGCPTQMSDTTISIPQRAAPLVAEHEHEVLASVGYSPQQIEELRESGVLPTLPRANL